ncbi:DNA methyltransferase [Methylotenera sp.]|uniref:DNA methyltransferase n=1 Tax=Methylotenera sp. TaxID=2051956 RepID=UPI0034534712
MVNRLPKEYENSRRIWRNFFARITLKATPHIVCGNALQTDWQSMLPAKRCSYVLGNTPFLSKSTQSDAQKNDM